MKTQKTLTYFYDAGQELILKVLVWPWVLLCIAVGIPAALILETVAFTRVRTTKAVVWVKGLKGRAKRIGEIRQRVAAEVASQDEGSGPSSLQSAA